MAGNQRSSSTGHYNTEREVDAVWAPKSLLMVLQLAPFLHWLLMTECALLRQAALKPFQGCTVLAQPRICIPLLELHHSSIAWENIADLLPPSCSPKTPVVYLSIGCPKLALS